ncbi:hypothetical protein BSK59_16030 [Paenibacillus odorifer]|uniref:hypothetical protein n=1 Tax=Paenibacillus odorifer TaxID=189426 RepID=UPI00096D942E|nr:hypothetical protein [Paenibacillus odorifer]OME54089.1 hypothetical protein BSK59_16030 [Paenibacillus odorifer]
MKFTEIEWLKKNIEKVSQEDIERLRELGVFKAIVTGEVNLPLSRMVEFFEEVASIVGKYMNVK